LNFAPTGLLMIQTMDRLIILAKTFPEKLFETSFEFCADGFVDDTNDEQTFNFGKNLL
jgi:hypothetical protein